MLKANKILIYKVYKTLQASKDIVYYNQMIICAIVFNKYWKVENAIKCK